MRGTFVLVVGPSGAGKDSLLLGAHTVLADDPRFVFARRCITRPRDAGGENHEEIAPPVFEARARAGGFLLHWGAHGLHYGLPIGLADELAAGRHVVANVSRTVLDEARGKFQPVRIVAVTVSKSVLAGRLAARGRESREEIAGRLARAGDGTPTGADVSEVANDGDLQQGIDRLVSLLRGL